MERFTSLSLLARRAAPLIATLLLMPAAGTLAATGDGARPDADAVNWSGTQLTPANNAPAGSQLVIHPPRGAQLPQVVVQLAGRNLPVVSASPQEVRVQLPAQAVTGPLTMTNVATRLGGTLVSDFRVVAVASQPTGSSGAASSSPMPRTLPPSALGTAAQQMSSHSYLRILAGGEDAPTLFGEDNTRLNQGAFDVSPFLEVFEFSVALHTGQQGAHGSSQATGHRIWHPARFVLRLGRSTPWLFDAARTNKNIDLILYLFHRHPESGVVEQNFQYRIQQGRIVSVRIVKSGAEEAASTGAPHLVELLVVPNISEMESRTGGTVMMDDWANYGG